MILEQKINKKLLNSTIHASMVDESNIFPAECLNSDSVEFSPSSEYTD